ncbi:hypothetical protein HC931_14510 [Candidatus Gracilibacteria bacterium]|nr:hypothetical protein [Candidatus Gracilibacteria bacterium]NJP21293.1 hypothetical protein [Hydrococcus sp. CRU_1_1]NJR52738.1 hypothetical protein [Leptolyngbyaceae cyanobacterium CSU_1_3]
MKRNQFSAIFAVAVVLVGVGTANIATAQPSGRFQNFVSRVCVPAQFEEILRTDFRDIPLNQQQKQTIEDAYVSYFSWVMDNSGPNACFENGSIKPAWVTKYAKYEAVVRTTLNRRQLAQWDQNVEATFRGRN